jgi:hypothetical protein
LISEQELSGAYTSDKVRYAKLLLIKRLREKADYTKYVSNLSDCFLNQQTINASLVAKTTDPNYYTKYGQSIFNFWLLKYIQTYNIENIGDNDLPNILIKLPSISGTNQIYQAVFKDNDLLSLQYWLMKTKILDTESTSLTSLTSSLYEGGDNVARNIFFAYGLRVDEVSDLALIEEARTRYMYDSERNYFETVLNDKIGFFGSLPGINNPSYQQRLSYDSVITDNRAQFVPIDLPDYMVNVGIKDFINFCFKVVQIDKSDYLQVIWRFPHSMYTQMFNWQAFSPGDTIKILTKEK